MTTVQKEVHIFGKTLMSGHDCKASVFPSHEGGIKFFISGTDKYIEAKVENVVSTDNCTVLGNDTIKVAMVEHFMAACAFSKIDNIDVYLSYPELPILDGSSLEWINLFNEAEIEYSPNESHVQLTKEISFEDNNTVIKMIPDSEFKIEYTVNFDHPDLKNKSYTFDLSQNKNEIISARTFGYFKDLEKFQSMGMAQGVTKENTVGLLESGYTTHLRSECEPIKHKILDLIGDLYLAGINPLSYKAKIIAKEAGHKSHVEFARLIKNMENEVCQRL